MGGLGVIGGIASAIMSGNQATKAAEAANAEYAEKKAFLENMFSKQYYSNITQRTDVQNMLRILQENQDKQAKRDEALSAITGATAESQLAAQDSRNKSYADALAEIASNASQLKDAYWQNYTNMRMGLSNPNASILQNSANQWGQAATNLFGSSASMLSGGIDKIVGGKEGQTPANTSANPSYFGAFNPKPIR